MTRAQPAQNPDATGETREPRRSAQLEAALTRYPSGRDGRAGRVPSGQPRFQSQQYSCRRAARSISRWPRRLSDVLRTLSRGRRRVHVGSRAELPEGRRGVQVALEGLGPKRLFSTRSSFWGSTHAGSSAARRPRRRRPIVGPSASFRTLPSPRRDQGMPGRARHVIPGPRSTADKRDYVNQKMAIIHECSTPRAPGTTCSGAGGPEGPGFPSLDRARWARDVWASSGSSDHRGFHSGSAGAELLAELLDRRRRRPDGPRRCPGA